MSGALVRHINGGRVQPVASGYFDESDFAAEVADWMQGRGGEPLVQIELSRTGDPHPTKTFLVNENTNVDQLVSGLVQKAQRDADAYRGDPQVYQFRAYFGAGARTPLETYSATFVGAYMATGHAQRSFPATHEGALALTMQGLGESNRTLTQSHTITVNALHRIIDTLTKRLAEKEAQEAATLALYKELLLTDRDEKRQAREEEASAKRWDETLSLLKVLLPSAMNKLLGAKVLPEMTSPLLEELRQFFDTLEPAQVETITSALKVNQGIAFADIINKFLDDRDRKGALARIAALGEQLKSMQGAAPAQQPAITVTAITPAK